MPIFINIIHKKPNGPSVKTFGYVYTTTETFSFGNTTKGFSVPVHVFETKKLFKFFEKDTELLTGGLFGIKHARQFAMVVYEGCLYSKLSLLETKGLFIGAYLYMLCKGFSIKNGYSVNNHEATFGKFNRILSNYEKKYGEVTDNKLYDTIVNVILHNVFEGNKFSEKIPPVLEILKDAAHLSLITGNKKQIEIKITQFANYLIRHFNGFFDEDNLTGFCSLTLCEQLARKKLNIETVSTYKTVVMKTRWGTLRNHVAQERIRDLGVFSNF